MISMLVGQRNLVMPRCDLPSFSGMFEHPVIASNSHFPLLRIDSLTSRQRHRWCLGVIDATSSVPRHILILVVWLSRRGELILRHCEFTLHVPPLPGCLNVVVINDFPATNDDFGAKFPKHGPSGHHTNGSTLIRMRDDLSFNEITLGVIIDDDLVKKLVFLKEQVGVPESNTSGWLCRQHVMFLATIKNRKRTNTILSVALQNAILVHFGLTLRVIWQGHFIINDVHHVPFLVNRDLGYMRRSPIPSPSSAASCRATTSPLHGRAYMNRRRRRTVVRQIPVRGAVLRRPTDTSFSRNGGHTATGWSVAARWRMGDCGRLVFLWRVGFGDNIGILVGRIAWIFYGGRRPARLRRFSHFLIGGIGERRRSIPYGAVSGRARECGFCKIGSRDKKTRWECDGHTQRLLCCLCSRSKLPRHRDSSYSEWGTTAKNRMYGMRMPLGVPFGSAPVMSGVPVSPHPGEYSHVLGRCCLRRTEDSRRGATWVRPITSTTGALN